MAQLIMTGKRRSGSDARSPAPENHGENEQHEEDEEEHLRDAHRRSRDAAETQRGGNQRDDEKEKRPA